MSLEHYQLANLILNGFQAVVMTVAVWLLSAGYRLLLEIHRATKRGN